MSDAKQVSIDLSAAIPVECHTLKICFPGTQTPTGWEVDLAGPQHPQSIAVSNEVQREMIDREKAIEFTQVNGRKWKVDEEDTDERRRRNTRRLVKRILGWRPNPVFSHISPDPIAFTESAAVDLFMRHDMGWAFMQIAEYFNSERAFTKASDKT